MSYEQAVVDLLTWLVWLGSVGIGAIIGLVIAIAWAAGGKARW